MRAPDSSATFVFIGDHSQDATWPGAAARPAALGKPDWERTSISLAGMRTRVVYGKAPSRDRA